jgi:hypothetical protein
MDIGLIFQILSTTIMIIGVVFGLANLHNFQLARKREAAIMMLNSFQTSDFVRGLLLVLNLPDGVHREEIDNLPEDKYLAVYMVIGTWERLGILVQRGEIGIDLVDDAYSGPIVLSWNKLGPNLTGLRDEWQRETAFEWFQWLAERMMERERTDSAVPAYVAHRDW